MLTRLLAGLCLASTVALLACGGGGPPEAEGLEASFAGQIAAVAGVSGFERDGSELAFSGPDGGGGQVAWRVRIDSAVVEPQDDAAHPYRGVVLSSWYAAGEPIEPTFGPAGARSNLPSDFLEAGIAQECWGLWSAEEDRWTW